MVTATFKSKRPAFKPEYDKIGDALILTALLGLTGLSIYGLLKLNQSTSGNTNPHYHWVRPYYAQNGTFVPGHYQTNADDSITNNWSSSGNTNPFTGKPGSL